MILTHLVFFEFFPGAGGEEAVPASTGQDKKLVIGMGLMGKPSVHQHPLFSRHKQ